MSQPPAKPQRRPLSMQTELARQQQLVSLVLLGVLLGPLTLLLAGVISTMVGKSPVRKAIVGLGGLLCLGVAGLCWESLRDHGQLAGAALGKAYRLLQDQPGASRAAWGRIGALVWPALWLWWRASCLLAPLAALNLQGNRVRTAEELEIERQARQEQALARRATAARAQIAKAPERADGQLVLGRCLDPGDLPWRHGEHALFPADVLGRHGAIIGGSGVGKSETMLRLAAGARQVYGWSVFVMDCKGERGLAERFGAQMQAAGVGRVGRFPEQAFNGWKGDGTALLNRLLAVLDYSEPYYRDMTKMLLNIALEAPPGPPQSSQELLDRLVIAELARRYAGRPEANELNGLRLQDAQAAYNRYRAFFKALNGGLDGGWTFDDVEAGYILLDGLTLQDQTASFGRYIVQDFAHYVARRKAAGARVLLIIDEYPVMAFSGAATASLFEMIRFHGASVMVTGQSYAAMGADFERILGAAATLILHQCGDPDKLIARAGLKTTFQRRVGFAERGAGPGAREYATGDGTLGVEEAYKIHPNAVKELPRGECFVISGGRYQRVLVRRVPEGRPTTDDGRRADQGPTTDDQRPTTDGHRPFGSWPAALRLRDRTGGPACPPGVRAQGGPQNDSDAPLHSPSPGSGGGQATGPSGSRPFDRIRGLFGGRRQPDRRPEGIDRARKPTGDPLPVLRPARRAVEGNPNNAVQPVSDIHSLPGEPEIGAEERERPAPPPEEAEPAPAPRARDYDDEEPRP